MSRTLERGAGGWSRWTPVLTLSLLALTLCVPARASAQATGTVRGTVTDASSLRPLVGVQVSVVGTRRGGLTDSNGNFLITGVPVGAVTVRVESIGYKAVEKSTNVTADQTAVVEFTMQQSAIGLDEIVVTGTAGRTEKRAIGNSVSTVNAAQITEAVPVNNVQQLLQGRTPGVQLSASTGMIGGSSKIRVRGASSLSAGNEPVVYVDGVRVQSGTLSGYSTGNGVVQGTNALDAINPEDIESIEVIKGPAAATLYGAEAATGVIQIITKKGRPTEGLQWTANMEYGTTEWSLDKITTYWLCTDSNIDNPAIYPGCQVFDKSMPLDQRILVDHPLEPGRRSLGVIRQVKDRMAAKGINLTDAQAQDFQCLALPASSTGCLGPAAPLRTGDAYNTNLSVRGGGESYNFYISGEKGDQQGAFFNNFQRRNAGRANFGFLPSQKLNFNVNVGYANTDVAMPLADNSSNSVLRNSFRGRAGATNDQWYPGYKGFSPELSNQWDNRIKAERLTMGVTANYSPYSWLQNRLTVGLDKDDRINNLFFRIDETGLSPWGATNGTGSINQLLNTNHVWTVDYTGTVNVQLSDNYSSAFSGGMQLVKRRSDTHETNGDGLVTNSLNLVSAAAVTTAGQSFSEQTSLGFFVQEQVGYKDRLFGTAAVRVDDNSAFGSDFSLVVYPKASLSYVISDEDFFNVSWIDEMKLRAAWGQAGNAPSPFSADRTLTAAVTTVSDQAANALRTSAYGNPNLKAETGQEIELGTEASLFNGRLGADVTYYYRQTKDALVSVPAPPSSGYSSSYLTNIGEIRNSGFEVALSASPVRTHDIQWDVLASLATNHNKLVSFGKDAQGNPVLDQLTFGAFASVQRHREGYPLGAFWGVDVERDASGQPVLDANGNVTVNAYCNTWPQPDCKEQYMGPQLPTRQIGLTNTITLFNNLKLYAFADYQGGHYQWCAICSIRSRIDQNTPEINDPNADPVELKRLKSLETIEFISKADFIKLREISATYTLPRSWTSRFGFDRAAVTVSGRNLGMWTKYKGTSDPEVSFYSQSEFTQLDYAAAPQMRRLLVSLSFNF